VVPPDRLGPDTLRAAVEGVLTTPGTGERIAALRKEMAAAGGADAAADLVEAELSRHAAGVR
jgi:UDP:flavonoid glycosyltransferase YjiC (YdhE family)